MTCQAAELGRQARSSRGTPRKVSLRGRGGSGNRDHVGSQRCRHGRHRAQPWPSRCARLAKLAPSLSCRFDRVATRTRTRDHAEACDGPRSRFSTPALLGTFVRQSEPNDGSLAATVPTHRGTSSDRRTSLAVTAGHQPERRPQSTRRSGVPKWWSLVFGKGWSHSQSSPGGIRAYNYDPHRLVRFA